MPDKNGSPLAEEMDLGSVLTALADPRRRAVVAELAAAPNDDERTCQSFQLPLAKSTQTHLFKVLAESGLILNEDYGNRKGVSLRRQILNERFPGLVDLLAAEWKLESSK